jgi:dihydrolipoamide dehydrogenase
MKIGIIGSGPGGYVAAIKAAMLGADVTIIEKHKVGGTCLNYGCIPTKSFLASSNMINEMEKASAFGFTSVTKSVPDFESIINRKREVVAQLGMGINYLLNKQRVKQILGEGYLISDKVVGITDENGNKTEIEFDHVIIATGSQPIFPAFIPRDEKIMASEDLLEIEQIPKSLIIMGGGVIGCEFGQFFNAMGTKVSIIEMEPQLLPFEDADAAAVLEDKFQRSKIEILTSQKVTEVSVLDDCVQVSLESGKTLTAERMLISVGRMPCTKNIGLENIGVKLTNNKICVDERMQTSIEGLYAIGDVVDTPMLAHVATREAIVAVENCFGIDSTEDYSAVPRCVYTNPEVASVGLTEIDATKLGKTVSMGKFPISGLGKAIVAGDAEGFIKVLSDEEEKIVGASIVGAHATELLAELTLAVSARLKISQLAKAIHPHPTLSEGILEAVHDLHKQSIHSF